MISVCYITNRKNQNIEWFLDSLNNQCGGDYSNIKVIVISFFPLSDEVGAKVKSMGGIISRVKPNVWNGPYRLCTENYFAASCARNSGLCLAPDGWIAFVDDLSVLMPGWLNCIRDAIAGNYIVLGAYKKVRNLVVENGVAKSWDEFPQGIDSRWNMGSNKPVIVKGNYMFGCSFAAPVEALLTVGGFPEMCDGLGFEDVIMGLALQNAGFKFRYDRRMLTLESEEGHHLDKPFKRVDKGISPNDKSHAVLNMVQRDGCKYFPNYYDGGIRRMREEVLSGKPFPIVQIPQNDWFDGELISEM